MTRATTLKKCGRHEGDGRKFLSLLGVESAQVADLRVNAECMLMHDMARRE